MGGVHVRVNDFKHCLQVAAQDLIDNRVFLSELDAAAGDGDHGITMNKIGEAIQYKLEENKALHNLLDELAWDIMSIGGGAAVSIWGTFFLGLSSGADQDFVELNLSILQDMFNGANEELMSITSAKKGDKTTMDAFIPALEVIMQIEEDNLCRVFEFAWEAAEAGAEATKDYKAKYGRAKNLGEKSIGSKDPGATSMALFIGGLYKGSIELQ